MKKVIIIGAGMGGLSAAIRLQNNGYDVEIFEQLDQPGGKMHQIEDQGHTWDVGPTIVMWPDAYTGIYEQTGRRAEDYIELVKIDPMYEVIFYDQVNRHYKMGNDLTDIMSLVESKGSENASGFLKYLDDMYQRYLVAMNDFIRRPFRHPSDIYNPYMLKQTLKLKTFDTADQMMARYIPNRDL